MRGFVGRLGKEDTVVGQNAYRVSVEVSLHRHQSGTVIRLKLQPVRIVDQTGQHLADIELTS